MSLLMKYQVETVLGQREIEATHGPLTVWSLFVTDEHGEQMECEIRSKVGNEYAVGDEFWAERNDTPYGVRLVRGRPPLAKPMQGKLTLSSSSSSKEIEMRYGEAREFLEKLVAALQAVLRS